MSDRSASVPLDLPLHDPAGETVTLGSVLSHRLTVVQLVRYFGCLPCQEWLLGLNAAAGRLADRDIGAVAIGGSADYQAIWLRDEKGVRLPLLLDRRAPVPGRGRRRATARMATGRPAGSRRVRAVTGPRPEAAGDHP